jgi:hypothetical protein
MATASKVVARKSQKPNDCGFPKLACEFAMVWRKMIDRHEPAVMIA